MDTYIVSPIANLSDHHYRMLSVESAICDEVIIERSYRTTDNPADLYALGFARSQCRLGSGLLLPTFDVCGKPFSAIFRPDRPRSDSRGRVIKYETSKDSKMYLDTLPRNKEAVRDPSKRLWLPEGIKKEDSLNSLGEVSAGLFGIWNWRGRNEYGGLTALADWDEIALNDREVIIAFDNDYREKPSVIMAMARLSTFLRRRGAVVWFIDLPEGSKLGVDDYLAQNHTIDDLLKLKSDKLPDIDYQTQAEALVTIAESRAQLIYTSHGQRLATVKYADGHREVYSIGERGSSFRDWLITEYRNEKDSLPGTSALAQAMEVLGAECRRVGQRADSHTRLGFHDGCLYLDLGTETWEAIEIDAAGWRIVKQPPVYFHRPAGMLPLPFPVKGGSLSDAASLLNMDPNSDESVLIQGWLIGAMHATGPYPHLSLQGAQGAGKSTATRMLRSIIDPNSSPTRRMVKEDEDLMLAAMNGLIVAIENVSYLSQEASDLLCGLSTGIGVGRRKKYSDADETLFYAKRPAILNGITPVATRGDLIDRLITVVLPGFDGGTRKSESDIWKPFHDKHPGILGALLDAVSMALKRQADVSIENLPRMADFGIWVEAAAPALGWEEGAFLGVYNDQREAAVDVEIEASPVAIALLAYLDEHEKIEPVSATTLLPCLVPYHTHNGTRRQEKAWPESPRSLGRELARIAPAMRQRGYLVRQAQGSRREGRKWEVTPADENGDVIDSEKRHQNTEKRHHSGETSPLMSPHNSLNAQNLGKNTTHGDIGDVSSTYSSVEKEKKVKKRLDGTYIYKGMGKETSPTSPTSPSPVTTRQKHHLGECPPPFGCPNCGSGNWQESVYTWRCTSCQREQSKPEGGWEA